MSAIEPLNDNIVVRPAEAPETTEGGLVLVTEAREQPVTATVVAVPETEGRLRPGDTVLYRKYAGTEVTVDGEKLLILATEDLLCRLPAAA